MPTSTTISIPPILVVITPFATAKMSSQMFAAAKAVDTGSEFPRVKYYLYCAAIELALKAAILGRDCSAQTKKMVKGYSHDLEKALDKCAADYDLSFLSESDKGAIKKINPYFRSKSLEYMTKQAMGALLQAFGPFPELNDLEVAAEKLQDFLVSQAHFVDANSSEEARGLMTIV